MGVTGACIVHPAPDPEAHLHLWICLWFVFPEGFQGDACCLYHKGSKGTILALYRFLNLFNNIIGKTNAFAGCIGRGGGRGV